MVLGSEALGGHKAWRVEVWADGINILAKRLPRFSFFFYFFLLFVFTSQLKFLLPPLLLVTLLALSPLHPFSSVSLLKPVGLQEGLGQSHEGSQVAVSVSVSPYKSRVVVVVFLIKFFLFILHPDHSFPFPPLPISPSSHPLLFPSPPPTYLLPPTPTHPSYTSLCSERGRHPMVSTKHGIPSCCKTKSLPLY